MTTGIELSLRVWYSDGRSLSPKAFLEQLGVHAGHYMCIGEAKPWQAARIVLVARLLRSYSGESEASELFHKDVQVDLHQAAKWLSKIAKVATEDRRNVDIFVSIQITDDQFEFEIPAEFSFQSARLSLPTKIITND